MNKMPPVPAVRQIRLGQNVRFDAWLYSMLTDNNLAYRMNPDLIASPEQLAFMVFLQSDQVYLPCSDATFAMLCTDRTPPELRRQYNRAWRIIMRLVRSFVSDKLERKRVLQFCRFRYRQYIAQQTLIPSRLVKRMTSLVLAQGNMLDDPWRERRRASTRRQQEMLLLPEFRDNLDAMPQGPLPDVMPKARRVLDTVELARLLCLSAMARYWQDSMPDAEEVRLAMAQAEQACIKLQPYFEASAGRSGTVLFLCDADGGAVFDLAMLKSLIRMGHRVIFSIKSGFYFFAPTLEDVEDDPSITAMLAGGIQSMQKHGLCP